METENKSNRLNITIAILAAIFGSVATVTTEYIVKKVDSNKKPKANFVYYSAKTDKKMAIAGIETTFINTSENSSTLKWTFPNGETVSEDTVHWKFVLAGTYTVKLEAFSKDGTKTDEKIMNCVIHSDYPENLATITILYDKNQGSLMFSDPLIRIGTIRGRLEDNSEVTINNAPKGQQYYEISGENAVFENYEKCSLNGTGKITITPMADIA